MRRQARAAFAALIVFVAAAGAGPQAGAQQMAPQVGDETPGAAQPLVVAPSEGQAARELVVATKPAAPFAFRGPDGAWTGISVKLFAQLADELDLAYRLEETTLDGMVRGTAEGTYDAAVAALTITADREGRLDFTYPFYSTGLGIAVQSGAGGGWLRVLRNFFTWQFLTVVAGLAAVLLAAGVVVWLFERRGNADQFDRGAARGVGTASGGRR